MFFEKQIAEIYRARLYARADDVGAVLYFSAEDFPGLCCRPYPFPAEDGHTLAGFLYDYGDPIEGRIVIFDHGMGGGHRSYMKEIEMLARHGYRVFAYDHTGCMASEGESTGGFGQSLSDLSAALTTLKGDEEFRSMTFSVVGHSWGGFAAMNIPAIHPDVAHVIAISGFRSIEAIVRQTFSGLLSLYRRSILAIEAAAHPDLLAYDAATSLCQSEARALIIHSEDDPVVHAKKHFEPLRRALSFRENISFLSVTGRGHNPNYTADAIAYKDDFFKKLKKRISKGGLADPEGHRAFLDAFDWHRMTAQDDAVWEEIFKTLEL